MNITTHLNVGDKAFFLMHSKVVSSTITTIETYSNDNGTKVTYTVKENPAGGQYTNRFAENDIFASKEDLLKSL